MSDFQFGPEWAKPGIVCCGKPDGCNIPSETCVFRDSPRKASNRTWIPCRVCGLAELATVHVVTLPDWRGVGGSPHTFVV